MLPPAPQVTGQFTRARAKLADLPENALDSLPGLDKQTVLAIFDKRQEYVLKPVHYVAGLLDPEHHPAFGTPPAATLAWQAHVPSVMSVYFMGDQAKARTLRTGPFAMRTTAAPAGKR